MMELDLAGQLYVLLDVVILVLRSMHHLLVLQVELLDGVWGEHGAFRIRHRLENLLYK